MKPILTVLLLFLLSACSQTRQSSPDHHYPLTGKVVGLDPKQQTAKIDAAAIPNFMGAMTMDYPVKSKSEFSSLHVGDTINATVNVSDNGSYDLSNIQLRNADK